MPRSGVSPYSTCESPSTSVFHTRSKLVVVMLIWSTCVLKLMADVGTKVPAAAWKQLVTAHPVERKLGNHAVEVYFACGQHLSNELLSLRT